jgi:chemotaxis methyl-accepting protein methylase
MLVNAIAQGAPGWRYKAPPLLNDQQFERWHCLLEQRTGISFSLHKSILQAGLYRRMSEIGSEDYEAYFNAVQDGAAGFLEWGELLNRITVQETRFFRDVAAFDFLREYLQQRIETANTSKNTLDLWSAGCASGEEAWSLAIQARHCIAQLRASIYYGVIGTDISNAALSAARHAHYRERQLANMPLAMRNDNVEVIDGEHVRIDQRLAERVCFVQSNLILDAELLGINMDVIFCQNVLIYFRQSSKYKVLDCLVDHLKPGGLLVVGQGESVGWTHKGVSKVRSQQVEAYIRR